MFSGKSIPYKFIFIALLFLIADFVVENINHRFHLYDFMVYYKAADAIAAGKQVYGVLFALGSGYFKYSPFTALLFYLATILPYYAACVIQFTLTSFTTIFICIFLLEILSVYFFEQPVTSPNLILGLALVSISTHLVRELGLGNVNVILLSLLCLALFCVLRRKFTLAGVFLGLVIITKPFLIFILLPLAMRRYFKTIFVTGIVLLICFALPAFFVGINGNVEMHRQWLNAIMLHAEAFMNSNTLDGLIRDISPINLPDTFQYGILLFMLIIYILFIRSNILYEQKNEKMKTRGLIMEWFVMLALIPSLFRTDTEHFIMTLPLIMLILIYLFSNKNVWLTIFFIIASLLYVGNISDLVGRKLSNDLFDWGVLGISNIVLLALSLYCYYKENRNLLPFVDKAT